MNGDVGTGDSFLHVGFQVVRYAMSFFHRQVLAQGEMEVYDFLRTGSAGAQAMIAQKFAAMLFENDGDFLADRFR